MTLSEEDGLHLSIGSPPYTAKLKTQAKYKSTSLTKTPVPGSGIDLLCWEKNLKTHWVRKLLCCAMDRKTGVINDRDGWMFRTGFVNV